MPAKTVNYNSEGVPDSVPTFLIDFSETYATSPRDACKEWYARSVMGLSVFFGLHALLGRGEYAVSMGDVPPEQYSLLPEKFTCEHFDPNDIMQLAVAAGCRYIVFPARFRDGFCLFKTETTSYHSLNSKANRDLLGEMASICEYHSLGLCITYSLGHDYDMFPKTGVPSTEEEKEAFYSRVETQMHELLDNYGPFAAICFEGIENIDRERARELYKLVRHLQPQILISCQQGLLGNEDIYAPGGKIPALDAPEAEQGFVNTDTSKPVELLMNMIPGRRGFHADSAGKHLRADAIWEHFADVRRNQANLVINTALLPDGSLDLEDMNELLEIGRRIEKDGYPN